MFSAWKKLTGKGEGNNGATSPNEVKPGMQTISSSLQKKFARGVQYNMKIIIRGDRSVGKTCLFLRLQGQKFREEYIPSDEISVACIQWSYKATDDVVKVEVWDVVDKGRKRRPIDGLKLANSNEIFEEPALDAEFLDVYKGTNGVIIVMDITKAWTFEYVQRELPKVPLHIPVLVLANHCDMDHHRTVTSDHVTYYLESLERQAPIRYTEGSMRNSFGLRYLHKFLNVPFLQLQRETLLAQLATNEHETQLTLQELDLFQEKDEASYDKFLESLTKKRRQAAESTGVVGAPQPINTQPPPAEAITVKKSASVPAKMSSLAPIVSQMSSLQSKQPDIVQATEALNLSKLDSSIASVEEFVPDGGGLDHSFLDEPVSANNIQATIKLEEDSDSEPEMQNPLVAGFQEDVDPDDFPSTVIPINPVNVKESVSSSLSSTEDLRQSIQAKTGGDILSDWLLPNKARRSSPEGREEGQGEVSDLQIPRIIEPEMTTSTPQKIKKPSKKEKGLAEKKKGIKEKKKKKSRKERDELEDFLNGTISSPAEEAYEEL